MWTHEVPNLRLEIVVLIPPVDPPAATAGQTEWRWWRDTSRRLWEASR